MDAKSQPDVESFYHLSGVDLSESKCQGLACYVARHDSANQWHQAEGQSPRVYCLGKCYAAPATGSDASQPIMEVHSRRPVVLERIVDGGALTLDAYGARSGLVALHKALKMQPEQIIAQLDAAQLRGRGGAGFLTAKKWRSVAVQACPTRHVVANLDEGDPGAYIDRFVAELDPFCLLEGMALRPTPSAPTRGGFTSAASTPRPSRRCNKRSPLRSRCKRAATVSSARA